VGRRDRFHRPQAPLARPGALRRAVVRSWHPPPRDAVRPLICAHRGASARFAENTPRAFSAAIAAGADMIETDVREGADGRLVLAHDPVVPDAPVVAVEELVRLAAGRAGLDLELKEPGLEEALLDAVSPRPPGLLVTSFHGEAIARVRELDRSVRTGLVVGPAEGADGAVDAAVALDADVLVLHASLLGEAVRRDAARARRELMVWTVNAFDALLAALGDAAVAGVVTDVPELAVPLRDDRARAA
jgi:glycerophosphoryl diester phosphodiesterase